MQADVDSDILILGAGPAGAAAALFAARQGLAGTVLERNARPPGGTWLEWLHPNGQRLLADAGVSMQGAIRGIIQSVRFVDIAQGGDIVAPLDEAITVVDGGQLTAAVLDAAQAAGATLVADAEVTAVETGEHAVTMRTSDGRCFSGRFFVAADGCNSLAAGAFGLDVDAATGTAATGCQSLFTKPVVAGDSTHTDAIELAWIVTSEDLDSFGYVFGVDDVLATGAVAPASGSDPVARFDLALAQWQGAGILPEGIDLARARPAVRQIPRGAALDFETHVAKHGLLIGDAGGFVSAASLEGLYPAIGSARLAVDACATALKADHPQDMLIEFDARWRQEMVEYLRLPNTDLRFLLPLVFANERMAVRLANALLGGTSL